MESSEAWGWGQPYELPLANWSNEEAAAEVWPPVPVEYEYSSLDIFGPCGLQLQACVAPESGGMHQQLADDEYYYYYSSSSSQQHNWAAAEVVTHGENRQQVTELSSGKQEQVVDSQDQETKNISNDSDAICVCKQVYQEFEADMGLMKEKMHRYPASLQDFLDSDYTVPRIVAIGPYHHHRDHVKPTEKVKHMAAICCVTESGHLLEEVYSAVVSAADDVRRRGLYDKDVMRGIGKDDFYHMMFFDACFLVQYMLMMSTGGGKIDESLKSFMNPNYMDILHDVILLENQIPWQVVRTVMRLRSVPSLPDDFGSRLRNFLQARSYDSPENEPGVREDYEVPHVLGLVRYFIAGRRGEDPTPEPKNNDGVDFVSASAMELAAIGIELKARNTMKLIDMGLEQGVIFNELSLAPLWLDRDRATFLLNMAALELCTLKSFTNAPEEDSAICSYLQLLSMLVHKEEDVDELREKRILEGGGGLTNEDTLAFFTKLQGLRLGPCYNRVRNQIKNYMETKPRWTKLNAAYHSKRKTIRGFLDIFNTLFK